MRLNVVAKVSMPIGMFLVTSNGIEAAVAEIEDDSPRNGSHIVKIARFGDHVFEGIGDSGGG